MSHLPPPVSPTTARRVGAAVAAGLAAAALAGCGTSLHNPYATLGLSPGAATTTATGSTVTSGEPPQERGGTIPAPARKAQSSLTRGAAGPAPQATLVRYAVIWGTWTAKTIPAVQTRVAQMSLGSARDEALQAVASYKADAPLQTSGLTSSTAVVGIAHGVGAAAGYWVVTTTEKTGGAGQASALPPTFHVNYAKLTHTAAGYVVNTWSPQS